MHSLRQLARNQRGAVMIETAIVAPVLILMSLGAFQVSEIVARQTELQEAAAQAASIAMAAPPDTADKRAVLKDVIVAQTGLDSSQVTVTQKFRCGTASSFVNSASSCVGVKVANFVLIQLDDTYNPVWTQFGVGSALLFNVDRYVLVNQT
ncbi:TadE/TadG family type IV pilus assembly protein [Novosphingobium ginsenosidimutans]|uniref:TadE/TadG family type IV pilus assembly protein n=1 Tax=Novosphingobium ginsenosidimutans TaxID=1176536 RepID=UPI0013758CD9|nr:TadE/TadG family type IV pilus assembly protein [Novosphingobium ginsenosidimutans]